MSRATPRRSGGASSISTPTLQQEKPSSQQQHSTTLTTLLPTKIELLLFSLPALTLTLGSLFSLLSPLSAPASSYQHSLSTTRTSPTPQPVPPPTYFAQKHNLLNVLFVKRSWAWATAALVALLLSHPSFGPRLRPVLTPRRLRAAIRWGALTTWWGCVTRSFFGPSIIDRVFVLTGGICALEQARAEEGAMGRIEGALSAGACKAAGGWWAGGWDVSGHVFLMALVLVFLGMETLPLIAVDPGRKVVDERGRTIDSEAERVGEPAPVNDDLGRWGLRAVAGVFILSWWMLLMTAIYFHTWGEKIFGLLLATVGMFVVYFLPRISPAVRSIIGVPGV